MPLNNDIATQLQAMSDEELMNWSENMKNFLRELDLFMEKKRDHLKQLSEATDETGKPLDPAEIQAIAKTYVPGLTGFPAARTNPEDPNYRYGILERIPDIENPMNERPTRPTPEPEGGRQTPEPQNP